MTAKALKTELKDIQSLRALFLQETNFQIWYDACHERGWTDSYLLTVLLTVDGVNVGYGPIKGRQIAGRDTVFESSTRSGRSPADSSASCSPFPARNTSNVKATTAAFPDAL